MISHYATVDGKYPWGIIPGIFAFETGSWKLLVFSFWMFSNIAGYSTSFIKSLLVALLPEVALGIYELLRGKKIGWIQPALLNVMHSAGMVEESKYVSIFGHNKVKRAPIFILDKEEEGYLLTIKPQGCPNANRELLPFLQKELLGYDVVPTGKFGQQYHIRKRRSRGPIIDDSFFY